MTLTRRTTPRKPPCSSSVESVSCALSDSNETLTGRPLRVAQGCPSRKLPTRVPTHLKAGGARWVVTAKDRCDNHLAIRNGTARTRTSQSRTPCASRPADAHTLVGGSCPTRQQAVVATCSDIASTPRKASSAQQFFDCKCSTSVGLGDRGLGEEIEVDRLGCCT